jgi:hypothetical protein
MSECTADGNSALSPVCFSFGQTIEGFDEFAFLVDFEEGVPAPDIYDVDPDTGRLLSVASFYPIDAHELKLNAVRYAQSTWRSNSKGLQYFYPTVLILRQTHADGTSKAWAHLIVSDKGDEFPRTLFRSKEHLDSIPTDHPEKLSSFPTSLLLPQNQ